MKKKGITLIALVVTIIVMLILVSVTLAVTLGPDGVIEKTKESKLDSRYASIIDKVKLRETALEISFERGEDGEDADSFIGKLQTEGLFFPGDNKGEDKYEGNQLKICKIDGDNYKYIINIMDGSLEGRLIWERIQNLPSVENNPDMAHMTLRIRTTTASETVTLPISYGQGLTIDWGDNTEHTTVTTNNPSHSYAIAGEYNLKIIGKATNKDSNFGGVGFYNNFNIIGIQYWGENDFKYIKSFGRNLQGEIPRPSRNSFEKVMSFSYTFYNCTGLTGSIPSDLFSNCLNANSFVQIFYGCKNLTGSIPKDLFSNCSNVTDFLQSFRECRGLTGSIPANLFLNCKKVTSFSGTFDNCTGLTGSIPATLFSNCSSVTSFLGTFQYCQGLTGSIPADLFSNCINVTKFAAVFNGCSKLTGNIPSGLFSNYSNGQDLDYIFCGCQGLTGSIPATLFSNCQNVTDFYGAFFGCKGLTGNIPATLFSNCPDVTDFSSTFYGCKGLTGNAPDLWNTHSSANGTSCFKNCTGLSNIDLIPDNWK